MKLIQICSVCEHSQRKCAGTCLCDADGKDIRDHARERYCPIGKYRFGPGDLIAATLNRFGIQQSLRRMLEEIDACNSVWWNDEKLAPDCGCKARQLAINNIKKED